MLQDKITKKIKSQRGTSIFFGLLLFLVASILSTVILNAAVTAVKTVEADRKTEQNYLTCSSAAKLLQDEIVDTEIVKTETKTEQESQPTIKWSGSRKSSSGMPETDSGFADFLLQYIQSYVKSNNSAAIYQPASLKISIPDNLNEEQTKNMKEITATLSVSKAIANDEILNTSNTSYDIQILLSILDGSDSCQMVLSLNGKVKTSKTENDESGSGKKTVTTITYGWNPKDIFYGREGRTVEAS